MTYIVTRVLHGCSTGGDSYSHPPNISSFDILGNPHSTQSLPGYEGLRQEEFSDLKIALNRSAIADHNELVNLVHWIASGDVDLVELIEATMPKILKPLRERGAGAAIGEIESEGNHEIDDFNVPCMRENHSHSTSLPTISQVDIVANLEAQGEVA